MAQTATKHDVRPRPISFKGAMQTLEAFQQLIAFSDEREAKFELLQELKRRISAIRVRNLGQFRRFPGNGQQPLNVIPAASSQNRVGRTGEWHVEIRNLFAVSN